MPFTPYQEGAESGFTSAEPEKVGFVQGLARSVASPFMRLGANVAGIKRTISGESEESAQRPVSYGDYLGEANPVGQEGSFGQRVKESIGVGAEASSNIVGGVGVKNVLGATFKGLVTQGAIAGAKSGLAGGALYGLGTGLQKDQGVGGVALDVGISSAVGLVGGTAIGGATPIAGKAFTKVGESLRAPGKELLVKPGESLLRGATWVQTKIIRPTSVDIRNGFKKENLAKHGIFGNLGQAFEKTTKNISDSMSELKAKIGKQNARQTALGGAQSRIVTGQGTPESGVPIFNSLQKLASETQSGGVSHFGSNKEKLAAIDDIGSEMGIAFGNNWHSKRLNFGDMIALKRRVGLKAAFEHDPLRSGPSAKEEVWNRFYEILKDETELVAGPEFGAINKKISELIPIEQAIMRRIPIAERNNAIGLIDALSVVGATQEPLSLTVGIANRLTRSGTVAKTLGATGRKFTRLGEKVENSPVGQFLKSPSLGLSIEDVSKKTSSANIANKNKNSIMSHATTHLQKAQEVNISDIEFNPNDLAQAKKDFATGVKSMTKGNILVEKNPKTGKYEVIDGTHRVQEALARGETTIIADVQQP